MKVEKKIASDERKQRLGQQLPLQELLREGSFLDQREMITGVNLGQQE